MISEKEIVNMTRRADQLRDYLRGSKLPTDKMDTIFVGRIVDRLSHYVQGNDNVNMLELFSFPFFPPQRPPPPRRTPPSCHACPPATHGPLLPLTPPHGPLLPFTPPSDDMVNERAVRILLECILVSSVVLLKQVFIFVTVICIKLKLLRQQVKSKTLWHKDCTSLLIIITLQIIWKLPSGVI